MKWLGLAISWVNQGMMFFKSSVSYEVISKTIDVISKSVCISNVIRLACSVLLLTNQGLFTIRRTIFDYKCWSNSTFEVGLFKFLTTYFYNNLFNNYAFHSKFLELSSEFFIISFFKLIFFGQKLFLDIFQNSQIS